MWPLSFIKEEDFFRHVQATIEQYDEKLKPYDLKRFNANIVDPIKLIFDKMVYRYDWREIINNEIFRQRDKSNNNSIGYFHQKLFRYISNCDVPDEGWDVIYKNDAGIPLPGGDTVGTVYVEMKNKHNTMNSSASGKTYIRMQSQLLADDDCACFLVEVIAKRSQNMTWSLTVDGVKHGHKRIRRVSMDQFYSAVTGQEDAFYAMCMVLPEVIENVVGSMPSGVIPSDTAVEELNVIAADKGGSFALALYMLGFGDYSGFM